MCMTLLILKIQAEFPKELLDGRAGCKRTLWVCPAGRKKSWVTVMGWEGKDKAHQDSHELGKWELKKDWAALSNLKSTNWYTAIHLVIRPWVIYMNNWALIKGFLSGFRKDFSAFAVYYSEICLVCWQSSKTHRSVLWCVGSETYAKTYWNSLCSSSIGILRRSWCHLPSKRRKLNTRVICLNWRNCYFHCKSDCFIWKR